MNFVWIFPELQVITAVPFVRAQSLPSAITVTTEGRELSCQLAALGIEVVDVRIKQINLPAEVSEAIYNRMRAEREAVARRHRSQGQEEAEKLRATADYEVTKTLAEAERQGRILRGEGDAESAKLFADAFSQDPGFYSFIRSLRAYEKSFQSNQDVMVLSPDSDFFRYMRSPDSARK